MIAVIGCGPHGWEIAHLVGAFGVKMLDDNLAGYQGSDWLENRPEMPYLAGAVWPKVRRQIVERVGIQPALDDGRVFFPGSHVGQNVTIGRHAHIGYNAVISHGCRVGDFVSVCANATLSGEVIVEDDVFIGANAVVIHGGITIGKGATVGAGSVVLKDVPPGQTVAGNPATNLTVRTA